MIVHRLYYGPINGEGSHLYTSEGLRSIVNDDIITERYTLRGSLHKTVFDSQIHQTPKGPVLSLTKVDPCRSDNRAFTCNHTIFVKLSEVIENLGPLLDFDAEKLPLTPQKVKVEKEG
jgi:hypothetical protein